MSVYLWINLSIIAVPLLLSFESRIKFYRNLPALAASIICTGIPFIIWDIIATRRGDWAFNEAYLLGIYLWGLPIEEFLFFITVPYASIFLYETLRLYVPEAVFPLHRRLYITLAWGFFASSFLLRDRPYTAFLCLFLASFFVSSLLIYPNLVQSKIYWIFSLIALIPFFIVNYLLTSMPIVTYNPAAFSAIRITSIPLEDFFYSFSMLSFNLLWYRFILATWKRT